MRYIYLAFILCWSLGAGPAFASQEIALLHSTPKATVWTDELYAGVKSVLGESSHVSEVFLGSSKDDDEHFETRFNQIRETWGTLKPAVVMADGALAFAFMRKYREDLFVGAPVVYCGMDRPDSEYLQQCGDCTGIPLDVGVSQTVDFIFTLRPETSTVVGIIDGSSQSVRLRRMVERAMEPYLDRAQVLFPGYEPGDEGGLDLAYLRDVAASVPRSAAVLFLRFEEDNKGDLIDPLDAVRTISSKSSGPLFVVSDEWMVGSPGDVVGGVVVSARAQGKAAGQAVLRILAGEAASDMLIDAESPQPQVDLTSLARFGIAQAVLPAGTVLMNAPEKPSSEEYAVSTGLVIGFVGVTVLGILFVFMRRRRHHPKKT